MQWLKATLNPFISNLEGILKQINEAIPQIEESMLKICQTHGVDYNSIIDEIKKEKEIK